MILANIDLDSAALKNKNPAGDAITDDVAKLNMHKKPIADAAFLIFPENRILNILKTIIL